MFIAKATHQGTSVELCLLESPWHPCQEAGWGDMWPHCGLTQPPLAWSDHSKSCGGAHH